jgi:hypothetical protein
MKYIMLIYQGTALEQQAALPEEEQKKVYADYQGSIRRRASPPGYRWACPRTRPQCVSRTGRV